MNGEVKNSKVWNVLWKETTKFDGMFELAIYRISIQGPLDKHW